MFPQSRKTLSVLSGKTQPYQKKRGERVWSSCVEMFVLDLPANWGVWIDHGSTNITYMSSVGMEIHGYSDKYRYPESAGSTKLSFFHKRVVHTERGTPTLQKTSSIQNTEVRYRGNTWGLFSIQLEVGPTILTDCIVSKGVWFASETSGCTQFQHIINNNRNLFILGHCYIETLSGWLVD